MYTYTHNWFSRTYRSSESDNNVKQIMWASRVHTHTRVSGVSNKLYFVFISLFGFFFLSLVYARARVRHLGEIPLINRIRDRRYRGKRLCVCVYVCYGIRNVIKKFNREISRRNARAQSTTSKMYRENVIRYFDYPTTSIPNGDTSARAGWYWGRDALNGFPE